VTIQELENVPKSTRSRLTVGVINGALSVLQQLQKEKAKVQLHHLHNFNYHISHQYCRSVLNTSLQKNHKMQVLLMNKQKMSKLQMKIYEVRWSLLAFR
jgi:hypothetical protein